jgi:CHAT domain-containing protein
MVGLAMSRRFWQNYFLGEVLTYNINLFAQTLPTLSESEMLIYLGSNRRLMMYMLSAGSNGTPEQVRMACDWYLRFQGLGFETLCRLRDVSAANSNPEVRDLATQARAARQRVQSLILESASADSSAKAVQVKAAEDIARRLETELNRELAKIAGINYDPMMLQFSTIARALPPKTAYVEILPYFPIQFGKPDAILNSGKVGAQRFVAFVQPAGDPTQVKLIDLGLAEDILEKTDLVQADLRTYNDRTGTEKSKENRFRKVASELHKKIFDPLVEHLGNPETILISAHDELHTIPFAALVEGDGKYLIEKYRIGYLHSGRDLVRPKSKESGRGVFVFADPDYDLGGEALVAAAKKINPLEGKVAVRGSGPGGGVVRGLNWTSLPATRTEAENIQKLLAKSDYGTAEIFLGPDALHERLLTVRRPKLLHLATHGFKLDKAQNESITGSRHPSPGAETLLAGQSNPFYRTGIVLAGCNSFAKRTAETNAKSGYVTAEELSSLDLQGTDLVVLSACLSGRGEVFELRSEGIYGPPRALLYAGARSVVTSLFAVPDTETQQLMTGFYKNLAANRGKLESLRNAQLEMIADRRTKGGAAHPFYWSAFTLTGDP